MGVVVLAALLVAGYFIYQNPKVQELFASPPRPVSRSRPPQVRTPEPSPAKTEPASAASRPSPGPVPRQLKPEPRQDPAPTPPPVQNQAENQQVARVLLQIMAAKGLAFGISLTVSDTLIEVNGETASQESRAEILQILDKGRGKRQVVADHLTIRRGGTRR